MEPSVDAAGISQVLACASDPDIRCSCAEPQMADVNETAGFQFVRGSVILRKFAWPVCADQLVNELRVGVGSAILANEDIENWFDARSRKGGQAFFDVGRVAIADNKDENVCRATSDHQNDSLSALWVAPGGSTTILTTPHAFGCFCPSRTRLPIRVDHAIDGPRKKR
jgi:hypothetical protein